MKLTDTATVELTGEQWAVVCASLHFSSDNQPSSLIASLEEAHELISAQLPESSGLSIESVKTSAQQSLFTPPSKIPDHPVTAAARRCFAALGTVLSRLKVSDSSRWPCKQCGRPGRFSQLRQVESKFEDGTVITQGCWYCNAESALVEVQYALEELDLARNNSLK